MCEVSVKSFTIFPMHLSEDLSVVHRKLYSFYFPGKKAMSELLNNFICLSRNYFALEKINSRTTLAEKNKQFFVIGKMNY